VSRPLALALRLGLALVLGPPIGAGGCATPTGRLDLVSGYEGRTKPLRAVVRRGDVRVDVARPGGAEVPAGEWTFEEGLVGESVYVSARVLPGRMAPLVVRPGETTRLRWGLPGAIECDVKREGRRVVLHLASARIHGRAGERYVDFRPKPFVPSLRIVAADGGDELLFERLSHGC